MRNASRLGFEKAVFFGSSGAIDEHLELGDFVVPTKTFRSVYAEMELPGNQWWRVAYTSYNKSSPSDMALDHLKAGLERHGMEYREGPTFSTDGDYDQEIEWLRRLREKGWLVADRECKTVLDRAAMNETKATALLYVSDRIGKETPERADYWKIAEKCMETAYPVLLDALTKE